MDTQFIDVEYAGSNRNVVPKKDAKDLIYGTCYKYRGLCRANTKRKLLSEMVNRKLKFFGHVMRTEEMENLVTTGYVEGKRARGRQRETNLTYLQKIKEKTPIELIHLTRDKGV